LANSNDDVTLGLFPNVNHPISYVLLINSREGVHLWLRLGNANNFIIIGIKAAFFGLSFSFPSYKL